MSNTPTLDSVPGNWNLYVRRQSDPTTTVIYTATFAGSGQFPTSGQVTVTGTSTSTGTWDKKDLGSPADENVTFQIPDPAGPGQELTFFGFMVGLAMGGTVNATGGSWSAYKISD